jgi:hypothetical protein
VAYLLDADVFIRAKNLHYGFDFCPGFWDWLVQANQRGRVFSIEKVGDEIEAGDDDLSEWARERGPGFFLRPASELPVALGIVSRWATSQSYQPTAIDTFLGLANFYLIAQALAGGYDIVTHEFPSDSTKRIKIPNVCMGLGIKCLAPFEMLRLERARFVLGTGF